MLNSCKGSTLGHSAIVLTGDVKAEDILKKLKAGEHLSVENAKITGKLDFTTLPYLAVEPGRKVVMLTSLVSFAGCEFKDSVVAYNRAANAGVSFEYPASFIQCTFHNHSTFANASFRRGAKFDKSEFLGTVSFEGASFGEEASFVEAKILGEGRFQNARFLGNTSFLKSTFKSGASFQGARFYGDLQFGAVNADGYFDFSRVYAAAGFFFNTSVFNGRILINNASLNGRTEFENCTFAQNCEMARTMFGGPTSFEKAKFQQVWDLSGSVFALGLPNRSEVKTSETANPAVLTEGTRVVQTTPLPAN